VVDVKRKAKDPIVQDVAMENANANVVCVKPHEDAIA